MPEGDTIHQLRARLAPLVGKAVRRWASTTLDGDLTGSTIIAIEAHGKNLFVRFDDTRTLHVHLRMLGRLTLRDARIPSRARGRPQLLLEVDGWVLTGNRIPVLRLLRPVGSAAVTRGLGPDILAPTFDEDRAVVNLEMQPNLTLAEALLSQRLVAGIGNVYKSEVLFLERLDPFARVGQNDDQTLRSLLRRARLLMQRNVRNGPRVTRNALAGPRLWVYRRGGRPCLVCGAVIIASYGSSGPTGRIGSSHVGESQAVRSTYHCPKCQASRP